MVDPHQVNIIIGTAICDAGRDHPDRRMDPEEAKQIAKCIVEALADAGLISCPQTRNDQSVMAAAQKPLPTDSYRVACAIGRSEL